MNKVIAGLLIGAACGYLFGSLSKPHNSRTSDEKELISSDEQSQAKNSSPVQSLKKATFGSPLPTAESNTTCKIENFPRAEIISAVKPSEVGQWRKYWNERATEQIKYSQVLWNNGTNDQANAKFDSASASSLLGSYQGSLEYDLPSEKKRLKYVFQMNLVSLEAGVEKNTLRLDSKEFGAFSGEFGINWLGTDASSKSLNVVWYNFNGNAEAECGFFGFQIPFDFQRGHTETLDVSCLDESFVWKPTGKIALTRK